MTRISSYIIGSPVGDGKALLVHGYSGALDLVECSNYDFLEANKGKDISNESLDEDMFNFLCKRGYTPL